MPLVFSTFGGLGKEATVFYNRLADLLSHKNNTSYPILDALCFIIFTSTFCVSPSWEQNTKAN